MLRRLPLRAAAASIPFARARRMPQSAAAAPPPLVSPLPSSQRRRVGSGADADDAAAAAANRIAGTIPPGGRGVAVSQSAEIRRTFTNEDVRRYAELIGDYNPLHFDPAGGSGGPRDDPEASSSAPPPPAAVVHGMLVASLFSSVFGTLAPGCVYRSQSVTFRSPVRAGDAAVGRLEVTRVRNVRGRGVSVTCRTSVVSSGGGECDGEKQERVCVTGEAEVWIPGGTAAAAAAQVEEKS